MPASIADGYVFGATETVTSAKLQTQFTSATISNISNTELDSVSRLMTNVAALPTASLIGGMLEYLSTTDILFTRHASEAEWAMIPYVRRLTNQSGATRSQGDVVVPDTVNALSVKTTTTANVPGAVLVVTDVTLPNGSLGAMQPFGFVSRINLTASAAIGDVLATSTTSGKATPSTGFPSAGNVFGVALGTGSNPKALLFGAGVSDVTIGKQMTVFTAIGTASFTPTKTVSHKVTVVGGGGLGGVANTGGGGAAGCAIWIGTLTNGVAYALSVGTSSTNSVFTGPVTLTGSAGVGGGASQGGLGAGASNGTLNLFGGDGQTVPPSGSVGGNGGASLFGGGGAGGAGGSVGQAGRAYGSGGGAPGTAGATRGEGAPGIVIVEWVA